MISVKKITLLGFVVIASIMFLVGRNITVADDNLNCTGEGAWTATDSFGNPWSMLIIPLDNTKKKFGVSVTPVNFDPTLGIPDPPFSDVMTLTTLKGVIEQVGNNLYDYQWVGYGLGADRAIIYIMRSRGTTVFLDCDTVESSGSLGFYGSWQDPFGEEPPALLCIPSAATAVRSPMVPPCEY